MKKLIPVLLNLFPRPVLIRLSYIFMRFSKLFLKGNNVECPVCEGRFKRFLPYGYQNIRENALCPKCLSLERHRLMWLYLKEKTDFFHKNMKVLHIAPEQCFFKKFRQQKNLEYITADLKSPLADIKMDIQSIPLNDNEFDAVFCNHVLEHVKDDQQALREILRVLKPGGFAILQVPMDIHMTSTYEDDSITDPKEREKHFRQKDHFRLYGADYPDRIKAAGFVTDERNYLDEINSARKERYRLPEDELMIAFFKPG
ncbi:MAG TPA: methyltransferase domain-containing protein [Bacteroidales bacterium]|nr:methyltransferase domain-containing protein [Bacteroidales bacterium]